MNYWNKSIEDTIQCLNTNFHIGLTQNQAEERLKEYGKNELESKPKESFLRKFFAQFKDAMIIILILAAFISFIVKIAEHNTHELFEPLLILIIVLINAFLGVFQENKAEKSLEALNTMNALHCKVVRDGVENIIEANMLVPGDIIRLEAGDYIPADARIISSSHLKSVEGALTGESVPCDKTENAILNAETPLAERNNMLYSGCEISSGTAWAVITSTGKYTELGKIANLLKNEPNPKTPLQEKLTFLGKYLGILAIVICGIIFVIGLINKMPLIEIFTLSISLAVSAIPEGLPAIVTIVLAIGVQRLAKKNSIIRKLPAVETLGSASIICSDKTGTLTQNKMTVTKIYSAAINKLEESSNNNCWAIRKMLNFATLCTEGTVVEENDGNLKSIGDPTETSIIVAAKKNNANKEKLVANYPRLASIPFDSDRKLMTTVHNIDGVITVIVKGAFDSISKICSSSEENKLKLGKIENEAMSQAALRVIAVATKEIDELPDQISPETLEHNLTFLGLIGMIDPPREEVKESVSLCRKAGIKPIMITGDHITTACAIAKNLDIMQDGDIALTGVELDKLTDKELDEQLHKIVVYARVSPENKIRIVKAWQRQNRIVAMTGDGVNDAPALKAADIGCAMGITGTDVAKGAADLILVDDNFSTIVNAVKEGRGIYDNIKKVVGFLLGTNIGEVITVFFSMLLWHTSPLLSMQLLWINLVTDGLPAIALGMEPIDNHIMSRKPLPKNETLFAHGYGLHIVFQGFMFAVLSLVAFYVGNTQGQDIKIARTMTFIVLALSQVVQAYNMRSEQSLFKIGIFSNKILNKACLISIILILVVLFTPLSYAFGLTLLSFKFYIISLILALIPLVVMEIKKAIFSK